MSVLQHSHRYLIDLNKGNHFFSTASKDLDLDHDFAILHLKVSYLRKKMSVIGIVWLMFTAVNVLRNV